MNDGWWMMNNDWWLMNNEWLMIENWKLMMILQLHDNCVTILWIIILLWLMNFDDKIYYMWKFIGDDWWKMKDERW
jgi:hypothetical protein